MTPFVQPLDAGVIRCFTAHYQHAFCMRALNLDDAGEHEIYKINLLEGMLMAREAWDAVEAVSIKNCWDHTAIQRPPIILHIPTVSNAPAPGTNIDPAAWNIIQQFASTAMTLPEAEDGLHKHLQDRYVDDEWRPALKMVTESEDINSCLTVLDKM